MSKYRELVRKAMDKGFSEESWAIMDDFVDMLCKKYPEPIVFPKTKLKTL